MDENKLVSVVIPTSNGSECVAKAVKSVQAQTYLPIQIIVVDDNGLGTEEQVKTEAVLSAAEFKDVIYIPHGKKKNGSAARNTGMRRADGYYIALLDDDDTFLPEKIEKQVRTLEAKNDSRYTVCYTGIREFLSSGGVIDSITDYEGDVRLSVLKRKFFPKTSCLLFTKKAAMDINGFNEEYRRYQDVEFADRLSNGNYFAVVPEICVYKNSIDRWTPGAGQQFEEVVLFYLSKLESYAGDIPKKDLDEIYDYHYGNIAFSFFRDRKIGKFLKYMFKMRNFRDVFHKLRSVWKNRKIR